MKKLVAVLLVFFVVMGSVNLMAQAKPRLTLDLSTLKVAQLLPGDKIGDPISGPLKNAAPFAKNWDDFMVLIPEMPGVDWGAFDRVIVKVKYYRGNGTAEIPQPKDSLAILTILYDVNGSWGRGADPGTGPNWPLKIFNVGGTVNRLSTAGTPLRMTKAPGALLFQNNEVSTAFIELTEVTFFKN